MTGVEQCVLGNLPSSGTDVGGPARHGTIDAISGVVHDYYRGWTWPAIEYPAPAKRRGD